MDKITPPKVKFWEFRYTKGPKPPTNTAHYFKNNLAKDLAFYLNLKPKEGYILIDIILNTIKNALKRGEDVHIRGLGTFKVKEITIRTTTVPRHREKRVRFYPSRILTQPYNPYHRAYLPKTPTETTC